LSEIDISGNAINDEAFKSFIYKLPEQIKKLHISSIGITDEGLDALCTKMDRMKLNLLDIS
jgi:Ran GTPase-activating protein (RanGAP) involved in mRNA processing and transport